MPNDLILNTNQEYSQDNPNTAALAGGGFVTVWDDGNQDAGFDGFDGLYGRVISAQGLATPEIKIAEDDAGYQVNGQVVGLADGSFIVAWESDGIDRNGEDDDFNIYYQRFSADGGYIGGQVQINPDRDYDHRIQEAVATPDGGFRIVYVASLVRTDYDVYTQRFTAAGVRIGGEAQLNTEVDTGIPQAFRYLTPGYELLSFANGNFLATYWENSGNGNGDQVWAQLYNAGGAALGGRELVSPLSPDDDATFPEIIGLAGGGFAIAWRSFNFDNDRTDLYVRTYNAAGAAVSGAVLVNDVLDEAPLLGELVALDNGGFFVSYAALYGDPSDDLFEVRGRTYGASGHATSGSFGISEFVYEDLSSLGSTKLADGSIVITWSAGPLVGEDVYATILAQGTAGNDVIDVVVPGTWRGFAGNDRITGTQWIDFLSGGEGSDIVNGAAGSDQLFGGSGNDTLNGGSGNDRLDGGTGVDLASYFGAAGAVSLSLAIAAAQATGGAGTDTLVGIEGLKGSDFNDRLTGDRFANTLIGGAGADRLAGGGGNDLLDGGTGFDTYFFDPQDGRDRVTFQDGADLLAFAGFGTGYDTAAEVLRHATQVGADVRIGLLDPQGTVTEVFLANFNLANLSAADFGTLIA